MSSPTPDLAPVLAGFGVDGAVLASVPLGDGHIHRTWAVDATAGQHAHVRLVAQALNDHVFTDLAACERNLRRIDDHLRTVEAVRVPRFRRTAAGQVQWTDPSGTTWRVTDFADDTRAGTTAADAGEAGEAARAFGAYAGALATLPGGRLDDTIPRFHDLDRRRRQLADAVAADRVGRRRQCTDDVLAAVSLAGRVADAVRPQPVRTVHNDAKVANVLFERETGRAAFVVDLDTTMSGMLIADVGELLRTASTVWPEDADEVEAMRVEDDRIEAVVRGFLSGAGGLVTATERAAFGVAGPLLAVENAVRFLADFLDGDRYFAVEDPGHNLRRARAQLAVTRLLLGRADLVARAATT